MIIEQYLQEISGNTLVITSEDLSNVGYTARMLTENKIHGFIDLSVRNVNGRIQYLYDVSSKCSLKNTYEHTLMKYEDIKGLINGLIYAIESASEFLLSENNLMLDENHIFTDIEGKNIYVCYYPDYDKHFKDSLLSLTEYILQRTDHMDDKGTKLAYSLYSQVFNGDFQLKKLIQDDKLTNKVINDENTEPSFDDIEDLNFDERTPPVIPPLGIGIITLCCVMVITIFSIILISFIYNNNGLNEILSLMEMRILIAAVLALSVIIPIIIIIKWINEKRLFTRTQQDNYEEGYTYDCENYIGDTSRLSCTSVYPRLVSTSGKTGELVINVFPFIIGKKESVCNGIIAMDGISRMHAKIINEGSQFKICDLGSTNGTFVNGKQLQNGEMILITANDEVSFAGEKFYFRR